jgi:hypothetical protein
MKRDWTKEEIAQLDGLTLRDEKKITELTIKLNRTYASIYSKIWKLTGGVPQRTTRIQSKIVRHHKVFFSKNEITIYDYKVISKKDNWVKITF